MTSSAKPVASAILAVYNSQSTIEACLQSLLSQTSPIEIIVIDDGSSDGTSSLMVRSIRQFPQAKITLLKTNHGGPALARNLGATHATTPILLFVDADMIFDPHYVEVLIAPILTGETIGTYTVQEQVANWDNVWARCWNLEEGWEDHLRFPKNPPKYGTDFRSILKSEFDKVGGFDNIGYTDTWSLFGKLGVRPLSTQAVCYHKNPPTLSHVFRQSRWAAKRPYKYRLLGTLYALLRVSLPVSVVVGILRSSQIPQYFIFKIVSDLGRFVGILQMLMTGNLAK